MPDQNLQCAECNNTFVFSEGEQDFYKQRGLTNTPKRCQDCRSKRKANGGRGGGGGGGGGYRAGGGGGGGGRSGGGGGRSTENRPEVACTRCGTMFSPPFDPKPGLPILCRDCFRASR